MFDDEAANNTVRITLGTFQSWPFASHLIQLTQGVSFELVRRDKGSGLTWALYQRGLRAWRRAIRITLLPNPPTKRQRKLIGYSGLGPRWIKRVQEKEGVVEKTEAYRWGYGLYVAPTSSLYVL